MPTAKKNTWPFAIDTEMRRLYQPYGASGASYFIPDAATEESLRKVAEKARCIFPGAIISLRLCRCLPDLVLHSRIGSHFIGVIGIPIVVAASFLYRKMLTGPTRDLVQASPAPNLRSRYLLLAETAPRVWIWLIQFLALTTAGLFWWILSSPGAHHATGFDFVDRSVFVIALICAVFCAHMLCIKDVKRSLSM